MHLAVLCGGISKERTVSLQSGQAAAEALQRFFPTELIILDEQALPAHLKAERHIIFPALHGTFGEDGGIQRLLDEAGFAYAGSDAQASRLCFDKKQAKQRAAAVGAVIAPDVVVHHPTSSSRHDNTGLMQILGEAIIIKPLCQGSSIGLHEVSGCEALAEAVMSLPAGDWLFEQRIVGRELSIGLLKGRSLGLVEVVPGDGPLYDYKHKYTAGRTRYYCPAEVDPAIAREIGATAERIFLACGCRDFARADFILNVAGKPFFLEINTLPGLTAVSLLPQSAAAYGYDFDELVCHMALPAIHRFNNTYKWTGFGTGG